jgi:hypothetical protein
MELTSDQRKVRKSCVYHEYGKCRYGTKCRYYHDDVHNDNKLEIYRNCGFCVN